MNHFTSAMRTLPLVIALVTAVPATSHAQLAQSDWPVFHHDAQHTGRTTIVGPQNPKVLWSYHGVSRLRSTPVVGADGHIFLGNGRMPVCKIDKNTGEKIWCATNNSAAPADRSTPVVAADGMVYVGARDNHLWAINPDGSVGWTFPVPTDGDVMTSPLITRAGRILMGSNSLGNGWFYGLSPAGAQTWLKVLRAGITNVSPAESHDASTVYVTVEGTTLVALDPATGVEKWRNKLESRVNGARAPNYTPVVGADGTIYVGFDKGLFAVDPNGTTKWLFPTGKRRMFSPPALGADGTIFFGASRKADSVLFAATPAGTEKWSTAVQGRLINCAPVVDGAGTVYLAAAKTLRAYAPAGNGAGDGLVVWERKFARRFFDAGPIVAGPVSQGRGRIYIDARDARLYALGDE